LVSALSVIFLQWRGCWFDPTRGNFFFLFSFVLPVPGEDGKKRTRQAATKYPQYCTYLPT
jgi:hypothetical protein